MYTVHIIIINLSNKLKQMTVKMRLNFYIIFFFHLKKMRYVLFSDKFAVAIPKYFFTQLLLIPFHTFPLKHLSQNYILIKFGKLVEKKGIESPSQLESLYRGTETEVFRSFSPSKFLP